MPVRAFDHVAIPTADAEAFVGFYKRLGFEILNEDRWRRGESRIFSVRIGGDQKINVHPEGLVADLRGRGATPGCGDLCFVWEGTVEDVLAMLAKAGVDPVAGPVSRVGARDGATARAASVYIHDPDGNLLEFMVYVDGAR